MKSNKLSVFNKWLVVYRILLEAEMLLIVCGIFIWMGSKSATAADCKSVSLWSSGVGTHPIHSIKYGWVLTIGRLGRSVKPFLRTLGVRLPPRPSVIKYGWVPTIGRLGRSVKPFLRTLKVRLLLRSYKKFLVGKQVVKARSVKPNRMISLVQIQPHPLNCSIF